MRAKSIKDVNTAIHIYYAYPEMDNSQIKELFGIAANSTIARYKKPVLEKQTEDGVKTMCAYTVNTKTAYEVWGIDVADLEKRRDKLKKLGLAG
ncbi:MAG: hypothetical protein ACI4DP_03400 [Candidatus Ornithomonoglobus sp.]